MFRCVQCRCFAKGRADDRPRGRGACWAASGRGAGAPAGRRPVAAPRARSSSAPAAIDPRNAGANGRVAVTEAPRRPASSRAHASPPKWPGARALTWSPPKPARAGAGYGSPPKPGARRRVGYTRSPPRPGPSADREHGSHRSRSPPVRGPRSHRVCPRIRKLRPIATREPTKPGPRPSLTASTTALRGSMTAVALTAASPGNSSRRPRRSAVPAEAWVQLRAQRPPELARACPAIFRPAAARVPARRRARRDPEPRGGAPLAVDAADE